MSVLAAVRAWVQRTRLRGSDRKVPEIAHAMAVWGLEHGTPEDWRKFFEARPHAITPELMGSLLQGCDLHLIHGNRETAVHLCGAADAAWRFVRCPEWHPALALADRWTRLGDVSRAEGVYRELLARTKAPGHVEVLLGWLLLGQERHEGALACLREAWHHLQAEQTPARSTCAAALALVLYERGESAQAAEYAGQAAAFVPLQRICAIMDMVFSTVSTDAQGEMAARAFHLLGESFYEAKCWSQAAYCYRRAISKCASFSVAHRDLGEALFAQGLSVAAVECYRQAIQLNAADAPVHRYLAHALVCLGKLEEAIAEAERALALDPNYVGAAWQLGELRKIAAAGGLPSDPLEWPT